MNLWNTWFHLWFHIMFLNKSVIETFINCFSLYEQKITNIFRVFFFQHFKVTSLILYSDWVAAGCQRWAVLLWPQLWSPTPPIWESCSWETTSCRIQEWSCCVVFWRVHTVDWRLWGQKACFTCVLRLIWCESCVDTKLQTWGWYYTDPHWAS